MSAWSEIDALKQRADMELWERRCHLLRYGWSLLPLEDGVWCARRTRESDHEDESLFQGEPELRAKSWEILLASVRAKSGKAVVA